jgi:hypothetical protein
MSKIDELKERALTLSACISDMNKTRTEVCAEIEKLEKLEAESAKPREFNVAIDISGRPIGVSEAGAGKIIFLTNVNDLPITTITVREVKPVVVTREMYVAFSRAFDSPNYATNLEAFVLGLKAAGIDATEG